MKRILVVVAIVVCAWAPACGSPAVDRELLVQGSTIEALLAGNYEGVAALGAIRERGDTGLGSFAGLDGEMIVLEGTVYKAAKNGTVSVEPDTATSPFYAVTFFESDIEKTLAQPVSGCAALGAALDALRPRADVPYAVVIKGAFAAVKVRSVGPYAPPYPPLARAIAEQAVFAWKAVAGTLVGFWFPPFMGNLNAAGWHLHFLSDDRTKGGHLLDLDATGLQVRLDETPALRVKFAAYPTKPLERPDAYRP